MDDAVPKTLARFSRASHADDVCDRFEAAWRETPPPRIEEFLPDGASIPSSSVASAVRALLADLVLIDLEFRWRTADSRENGPEQPCGSLRPCQAPEPRKDGKRGSESPAHTSLASTESPTPDPLPSRPLLEDYARTYPLLGSPEGFPLDFIAHEYLVRHRWGDRPDKAKFLARFPCQAAELPGALAEVEARLATRETSSDAAPAAASILSAGLNLRCPHCHDLIPVVIDESVDSITCTSCARKVDFATHDWLRSGPGGELALAGRRMLGHFELTQRLGEGGFGEVWKAWDTKLGRPVAIKIPRKGRLSREETQVFLRDARAAAQLCHPNIVAVHELGLEGELLYIVSDFIEGVSLDRWLVADRQGRRTLTHRRATELLHTIAETVHFAHQQGVIHRDLKPSNTMIDTAGQPHLIDFGLAKHKAAEATMTAEGVPLGTPAYMAPEQARGEAHHVDARADVYSLGVIFFELLTGERPFRGNWEMVIKQVIEDEAPSPRKLDGLIPRDLETICLKCLEKDPDRRYPSARVLADELASFLEGRPIQARPVGHTERAVRWCRRNPVVASLIASVIFSLTSGLVAALLLYAQALAAQRSSDASLDDAMQVVDSFCTQVSQERLLNQPGMQPLRQSLLGEAQRYYERFCQRSGNDPDVSGRLAQAQYSLGRVCEQLGLHHQAQLAYESANSRLSDLMAADPENPIWLERRGAASNALGGLWQNRGNLDKAAEHFQDALRARQQLAELNPQDIEPKRILANTLMNLALLEQERLLMEVALLEDARIAPTKAVYALDPRWAQARSYMERAQEVRQEALRIAQTDRELRHDSATGYLNFAKLMLAAEKFNDARQYAGQAVALLDELLDENPGTLDFTYDQLLCRRMEIYSACRSNRWSSPDRAYETLFRDMEQFARANPSVPDYQRELAETYINLAADFVHTYEHRAVRAEACTAILQLLAGATLQPFGRVAIQPLARAAFQPMARAALRPLARAADILEPLCTVFPDERSYRNLLVRVYRLTAQLHYGFVRPCQLEEIHKSLLSCRNHLNHLVRLMPEHATLKSELETVQAAIHDLEMALQQPSGPTP